MSQSPIETVDLLLAHFIMTYLGYQSLSPDDRINTLSVQHQLDFKMDGIQTRASVDIALVDEVRALLCLYVEDRRPKPTITAMGTLLWHHPQVFAHALGAYNANMVDARQAAREKYFIRKNDDTHSNIFCSLR